MFRNLKSSIPYSLAVSSPEASGDTMDPNNPSTLEPRAPGRVASPLGIEEGFARVLRIEEETSHKLPDEEKLEEISQEELDTLYGKDMYELSINDRDQVYLDIHGVAHAVDETPEFMREGRTQLLAELDRLVRDPRKKTIAYEQALEKKLSYTQSEKLHLTFLRADRWDPKRSASRMVNFFQSKLDLFGPKRLTSTIRIADLSKEDKKSLESGFFQLLPVRDVGGRAIMTGMPMLRQYKEMDNLVSASQCILWNMNCGL